jgi:heme oxygenase
LGISRIAEIYYTFEKAWGDYLDSPSLGSKTDARYRALLQDALIPEIARSQRLSSDLAHLRAAWGHVDAHHHNEAVRSAVAHISASIQAKPYVLLAYSWIMYMALFNGGRWIREQLLDAGPSFWHGKGSPVDKSPIAQSYLSFWHFDGSTDGEDVKLAFRARLVDAGSCLTEAEREDVVAEAQALFQHCLNIVMEIDTVVSSCRPRPVVGFRRYNFSTFYLRLLVTILILGGVVCVL